MVLTSILMLSNVEKNGCRCCFLFCRFARGNRRARWIPQPLDSLFAKMMNLESLFHCYRMNQCGRSPDQVGISAFEATSSSLFSLDIFSEEGPVYAVYEKIQWLKLLPCEHL
jgi:hypothetical protein